jgi:hypothetical protein
MTMRLLAAAQAPDPSMLAFLAEEDGSAEDFGMGPPARAAAARAARARALQAAAVLRARVFACLPTAQTEAVADAAVRGMVRKQLYVILPAKARVIWWIKRLSPRLFFRVIALEVNRRLKAR